MLATCGCSWLRVAGGPRWIEGPRPVAEAAAADHRDARELTFLVFGDAGTGGAQQRRVAEWMARECAARGGCDFALALGDNVYPAGVRPDSLRDGETRPDRRFERRFESVYRPLGRLDIWVVAGNHDWYRRGSVEAEVRYTERSPRWRMPALDYAVPALPGWLHLYGVDTTSLAAGRDTGQVERAREALCGRPGWRLLFGHHPVYTSGVHGDARGVMPRVLRRLVEPLLEPCAVQVYFAGHDHHQEHLSAPGFEQVIQGAAGKLRRLRQPANRPRGVRSLSAHSSFGFALVCADERALELRFFGYRRRQPPRELYCRRLQRAGERIALEACPSNPKGDGS